MFYSMVLMPLVVLSFIGGVVVALTMWIVSRKQWRPHIAVILATPFGCAVLPIIGLLALWAVSTALQKSDAQLYEEIFGQETTMTDEHMLFDDFGGGRTREIYMRAQPNAAELQRIMAAKGLKDSDMTLEQFVARGSKHGFTWWADDLLYPQACNRFRIMSADGYRGWQEFRLAICLDEMKTPERRFVFGIAQGR